MPTFQCGKFRVWFGTDNAPAPIGPVPRGGEYAVRVGVLPRDADIVLRIRYRRQGGTWMFLPAGALPGADGEGPQYYEGIFRDLAPGAVIEYTVQCQHHGQRIEATDSTTVSFENREGRSDYSRQHRLLAAVNGGRAARIRTADRPSNARPTLR